MRHAVNAIAMIATVAITFAAALSCIEGFVNCDDDVGHGNILRFAGKVIAAAGAVPIRRSHDGATCQIIAQDKIKKYLGVG